MGNKLYVGNLPYSVRDGDLEQAFGQFGAVTSAKVMMERDTGRSKGFGFVEMGSEAEAQAAINGMNGQPLGGRSVVVNEARPMEARPRAAVVAAATAAAVVVMAAVVAVATAAAVVAATVVVVAAVAAAAVVATAAVAAVVAAAVVAMAVSAAPTAPARVAAAAVVAAATVAAATAATDRFPKDKGSFGSLFRCRGRCGLGFSLRRAASSARAPARRGRAAHWAACA